MEQFRALERRRSWGTAEPVGDPMFHLRHQICSKYDPLL